MLWPAERVLPVAWILERLLQVIAQQLMPSDGQSHRTSTHNAIDLFGQGSAYLVGLWRESVIPLAVLLNALDRVSSASSNSSNGSNSTGMANQSTSGEYAAKKKVLIASCLVDVLSAAMQDQKIAKQLMLLTSGSTSAAAAAAAASNNKGTFSSVVGRIIERLSANSSAVITIPGTISGNAQQTIPVSSLLEPLIVKAQAMLTKLMQQSI